MLEFVVSIAVVKKLTLYCLSSRWDFVLFLDKKSTHLPLVDRWLRRQLHTLQHLHHTCSPIFYQSFGDERGLMQMCT